MKLGDPASSPPTLEGVVAKLVRAGHHLDSLREACDKVINGSAGEPLVKREGDWEVVYVALGEFPNWPGIISGDYVHNLRSALDHLIWQLVKVCGNKPGPWNSFPIYADKDDFVRDVKQRPKKRGRGPLDGVDPRGPIWELIERAQPYNNTALPDWLPADVPDRDKWKPRLTTLGILSALDNFDKHRMIHGFNVFPGKNGAINKSLSWNSDAVLVEQREREDWNGLEGEVEVARFRFRPGPQPNVRVTGSMPLQVGFAVEFTEKAAVTVLMESMERLRSDIRTLVNSFIPHFPAE